MTLYTTKAIPANPKKAKLYDVRLITYCENFRRRRNPPQASLVFCPTSKNRVAPGTSVHHLMKVILLNQINTLACRFVDGGEYL